MRDIAKTLSYGSIHIVVGFTVAYLLTGSVAIAGGIALLEPIANTVVFYIHEKVWKRIPEGGRTDQPRGAAARRSRSLIARPRPSSGTGITAMPVNLASSRA
ncbi:DUF2061 domain-containing protein [Novispirillum sp. DQ9]|uniref:DUF2061 domain-containing protein n=1 Tax=Novispirillum sp. DQ9 TaxID=3398612 RepID=UPI003C799CDA